LSSTYEDLKEERQQVVKTILEMGHFPVGMEMFSAGDDAQWQIIKRTIDQSDYYIVVIAHRYGSMDGPVSYTEKEYDYATKMGIPVLAFVIDQSASWPTNRLETDAAKLAHLQQFKAKVKNRMVGSWKSAEDLYTKVVLALMKQISLTPRR